MKFRPCIDIHNGKVKQIVGSSLEDGAGSAKENFVSEKGGAYFAEKFKGDGLTGGHVILLNREGTPYFEQTRDEAFAALRSYPGGLQLGGGVNEENADTYLEAGASHVIVTSYVFFNGDISMVNLGKLETAVGKEHLVLDLSCSLRDNEYYIMTDRWQKYTRTPLDEGLLYKLSRHCDEFLVHAIDVEGKQKGIDERLVALLATMDGFPVTYAGGIRNTDDIRLISQSGRRRVDFTVGSALSIYGGPLEYTDVLNACKEIY